MRAIGPPVPTAADAAAVAEHQIRPADGSRVGLFLKVLTRPVI